MTKAINLSNLERYNNKLKPLVVTDAEVVNNDLQLKYLDNETKTVSLPEAPKAVSDAEISNNEIQLTFTDSDTKTLELPTVTAVSDAEISGNDLQLTFTDSDTKTLELPEAPKAVADAEISGNELQLTYTDSDTKTLELPGGSAVFPTRSVSRFPTFFEVHFQFVESYYYSERDGKLNIPLEMAKDIIKIYAKTSDGLITELGFANITDVTESKKTYDDDTVFLVAVNCNPKNFYDLDYEIYFSINTSFGNFDLVTAPIAQAVRDAASRAGESAPELQETRPAQVIRSEISNILLFNSSSSDDPESGNYYVIRAVLCTDDFTRGDRSFYNDTISIALGFAFVSVSFKPILEDVRFNSTMVTFTETILP